MLTSPGTPLPGRPGGGAPLADRRHRQATAAPIGDFVE